MRKRDKKELETWEGLCVSLEVATGWRVTGFDPGFSLFSPETGEHAQIPKTLAESIIHRIGSKPSSKD